MVNADASGKGNSVFARSLAHTELAVREKAFARLAAFLAARAAADGKALERLDLLKIWKGLFYAFWHSDLAPIQVSLAPRVYRVRYLH
jgi:ribosomal RNA-processing protein 1